MNWPLFLHPALLGGLAAVAIPILIHLLLKTRRKRLRFSTLLFFRHPDEQAKRRRKVRHWLLLVTRMLLISLLVLGFARPYLASRENAQANQPRRQVILVLDRSASLWAVDREGRRWDRATQALRQLLASLRPDDRAALISCGTRAEALVTPSAPEDVVRVLSDLKAGQGTSELGEGLELAGKMVGKSGPGYTNTIYVVSDLQRSSCHNLGSYPIPQDAELKVLSFGDLLAPNVAVTELSLETTDTSKPAVTLANFSDEDAAPFKFRFLVDGKERLNTTVQLLGGATTNLELSLPRLTGGWHSAEARIQPKDALELDDARYQAIFAPPPIRILVAEGRQVPKLFDEESFFVISALDPSAGMTNEHDSAFQIEKTGLAGMAAKLGSHEGQLPYEVVVLPALQEIPAELGKSLEAYARAGGGVLMFLGDTVSANRYASEFGGVLPAQLGAPESANDLDWRLWENDRQSPVFGAFRQPNSGNLSLARFTRRFSLKPDSEGSVLARFQDGVPLMVGRNLEKGRIILVNTSADTLWTDWPKHRTFVPWLHSVARYLGGGQNTTGPLPDAALLAGTESDLSLGSDLKKASLKLQGPDGHEVAGLTDDAGVWRDLSWQTSGFYSLRAPNGKEIRRVAVNTPVSESDLVAMPPAEFERQVARLETPANHSLAASLFGPSPDRHDLWRLCLMAVFGLLFLELMLANKTIA
jgi:hypothetical protein